jgi:hypothetical protein
MEDTAIIEEFPNYSISRDGVVMNNETGHILKSYINKQIGYFQIKLEHKWRYIHRLLAKTFITNPENKLFIDHINRDRLDNRLENLRWATRSENNYNKSLRSDNLLKETNISPHARGGYNVALHQKKIRKYFKTLEEAIAFRDAHK